MSKRVGKAIGTLKSLSCETGTRKAEARPKKSAITSSPGLKPLLKPLSSYMREKGLLAGGLVAGQLLLGQLALAGPEGGTVVSGQGSLTKVSSLETHINQESQNLLMNFDSFDLTQDESVLITQPDTSSWFVAQILGGSATSIFGSISANGQIALVNPRGLIFGESATISAAGIFASTLGPVTEDIFDGNQVFAADGGPQGMVVNQGLISASVGGSVTLLGESVSNEGVILATLGQVNLASGSAAVVNFGQERLLGVQVTEAVLENNAGLKAAVSNSGTIDAAGGQIVLTGKVSRDLFDHAVNNEGVIRATSGKYQDGVIRLSASGGSVLNTGTLDASAGQAGAKGGSIELVSDSAVIITDNSELLATSAIDKGGRVDITAGQVRVDGSSVVDTSGARGGGKVSIVAEPTGNQSGATGETLADNTIGAGVQIKANATSEGDGGLITIAGQNVVVDGNLEAKGGEKWGSGGNVHVTGSESLQFHGIVDVSAPQGELGTLTLESKSLSIDDSSEASISATSLQKSKANLDLRASMRIVMGDLDANQLDFGNRNVSLTVAGSAGSGDTDWIGFLMAGADDHLSLNGTLTIDITDESTNANALIDIAGTLESIPSQPLPDQPDNPNDIALISNNGRIRVRSTGALISTGQAENTSKDGQQYGDGGSILLLSSGFDGENEAGTTIVEGSIDVSSQYGAGGSVSVLGDRVGLTGDAVIDASGYTGGGQILVGGNYQGQGPEKNALKTFVGSGVKISADALTSGDGGKVIVWADEVTRFYGSVTAKGGQAGGDGGFVEISAKNLDFDGQYDLTAPNGSLGTILFDPKDIEIRGGAGDGDDNDSGSNFFKENNFVAFGGNDIVNFGDLSGTRFDIYESELEGTTAANIILQATDGITVSGSFTGGLTLASGVSITLETRNSSGEGSIGIDLTGTNFSITTSGTGSITMIAGSGGGDAGTADLDVVSLTALGTGDINLTAEGRVRVSGDISVANAGVINLTGTDVRVDDGMKVTSVNGMITVDAGTGTLDLRDGAGTQSQLITTNAGITIIADDVAIDTSDTTSQIIAGGGNTISISNSTSGLTIGLGGGTGTLNLIDGELQELSTTGTVSIGSSTAGAITLDTVNMSLISGTTDLSLTTGAGVNDTGAGTHVISDALTISSVTGVGTSTTLETTVTSLDVVNSTSGNISITETDALTIVQAKQLIAGNIQIATNNGSIIVDDGLLAANTVITTAGTGTITLDAGGINSDITLDDGISSVSGAINLSAYDSILLSAGGDITSTSGNVLLQADADDLNGGSGDVIAMADGAVINAGSGAIGLDTNVGAGTNGGNITLGELITTNATTTSVVLDSDAGIVDGGDSGVDIQSGGRLKISSVTGVGSSGAIGALETTVTSLDVVNSISGNIDLLESDGITVFQAKQTTVGNIQIATTNGSIVVDDGLPAANTVITTAGAGTITLDAGGINSDITLNDGISSVSGAINLSAYDSILLSAGGDITSTFGNVSLQADADDLNGDSGDVITMADGAVINAGSGAIGLDTNVGAGANGGNITLGELLTTNTTTTSVVLDSDAGIVDGGDSGVDIQSGGRLKISSVTGVGSSGAFGALETSIASLDVVNSISGNIDLLESDGITVFQAKQTTAGNIQIATTNGSIVVDDGLPAANTVITTAGAGTLTLDAGGINSDITLNDGISSVSGTINLSAYDSILLSAGGGITSASGNVSLQADVNDLTGDGGDVITMADGAVINAGSGTISLDTNVGAGANGGDITLGELITTNATTTSVVLDSDAGIVDGGDTGIDIQSGGRLKISSVTGVGSSGVFGALETTVTSLDVVNSTSGNISITESDALIVMQAVQSVAGSIAITAGGLLQVSGAVTTLLTDTLSLTGTGITVDSGVTISSVNGLMSIDAGTGTLTLSDTASTQSQLVTTGAGINITADGVVIGSSNTTTNQVIAGGGNTISISNTTFGQTIGLGGIGAVPGTLNLDSTELSELSTTGTVSIGSSTAGAITLDTVNMSVISWTTDLSLTTGADVNDTGTGTHVLADALTISSVTGVGTSSTLETTVTSLDVVNGISGNISITETDSLTVIQAVQSTAGNIDISTGGDLLVGSISTPGVATLTSAGVIDDATASDSTVDITAAVIDLNAATKIGSTAATDVELSGTTITAHTTDLIIGAIDLSNQTTLASTVTLTTVGAGSITFDQTGGGALDLTATSANGAIMVSNTGASLTATNVISSNTGNVTLSTLTLGNVLVGSITATGDQVQINSVGVIDDATASDSTVDITAAVIDLNAATKIGSTAATDVELSGTTITADTTNTITGVIDLSNQATVASSANLTTAGTGSITYDQSGNQTLDLIASSANGAITVSNAGATLTVSSVVAGGAGNVLLSTSNGSIDVNDGLGTDTTVITTTGAGTITLDANGLNSDIILNDGLSSASGAISLSADDSILLLAGGDISSASGNVSLQADADDLNGGSGDVITMSDGAVIDAGSGTISLDSNFGSGANGGNITVGRLVTTNATASSVTLESGASIVDGGNTGGVDVQSSGRLTVNTSGGFGTGDALEINVPSLDITNAVSGEIVISTTGDIEIAGLVNTVANDGNATTGGISVSSGGVITVSGAVSAIDGDIVFDATGTGTTSDLLINSTIDTTLLGSITLSANNDVTFTAFGSVTSSGSGAVTITADADALAGGALTMVDLSSVDGGSGVVTLSADGNITLGKVVTTNTSATSVNLTSNSGAIVDGGNTDVDVQSGGRLVINAATGVGSANAIETAIASLDVVNSTSGNIDLLESDGITILQAKQTTAGNIQIATTNGSIVVDDGLPAANTVIATVGTGTITLDAGGINSEITQNDGISSVSGAINLSAYDSILLSAGGDITSTSGNVSLQADADDLNGDSGDVISMADGAVINAGSGTISLDSNFGSGTNGGDITVGRLVTTNATASSVTLDSGASIVDAGDTGGVDVQSSGRLTVNTSGGFGTGNVLEINVPSLDVTNAVSGEIVISTTGDIEIAGLVNTVADDGNATTGGISVSSGGVITLSGAVSAIDGDIAFDATGTGTTSDLLINSTIDTTLLGSITLSANNDVTFTASGSVTSSGGGAVTITADADALAGGALTMVDLSSVDGGSGVVTLSADGNITLGKVVTTNTSSTSVNLTSSSGAIVDGGETDVDVQSGGRLVINAVTGVGSADAIETTIASLDVINVTGGNIEIAETDALTIVQAVQTTAGDIVISAGDVLVGSVTTPGSATITSTGAIDDATTDTLIDITASAINLSAATGIGSTEALELSSSSITSSSAAGVIDIDNDSTTTSTVSLTTSDTSTGSITFDQAGGGALNLSATSASGAITASNTGANLTAISVNAGGGSSVDLSTSGSGNVLVGSVTTTGTATITSAGAIDDATTDTVVDITATTINLSAATGVGSTEVLELSGGTITASSTTGNIDIDNDSTTTSTVSLMTLDASAGAITFDQIGGGALKLSADSANGAITASNTGANLTAESISAGGGGSVLLSTITGSIIVDDGIAADSTAITTTGTGAITLTASGGTNSDITLNDGISSASGSISLSANDSILLSAGGDIASTSGNVSLQADADDLNGASGDVISMADGALINAGTGTISLDTNIGAGTNGGDITLGELITTNVTAASIVLDSDAAIVDGGDSGVDIQTGGQLTINSVKGVGTGNAIETTITTLDVTNTASGNIEIAETNGLNLLQALQTTAGNMVISAGGNVLVGSMSAPGTISLSSAGAIDDASADTLVDIAAATINLTASTGIGTTEALELRGTNISANTTAGSIDLGNSSTGTTTVNLTTSDTVGGIITFDQTGGGNLDVNSASSVSGAIIVTNTDANLIANNVTTTGADDITLSATSGDVLVGNVNSGANLNITANGLISSVGPLVVTAGITTLDAGGAVVGVNDISLNNASNDFSSLVIVNAGDASITDMNSIVLDDASISGTYTVSSGGQIDLSGNVTATNTDFASTAGDIFNSAGSTLTVFNNARFSASTLNDITLSNVNLTNMEVVEARNVTVQDADSIKLLDITATGLLDVTVGNGVSLSGVVNANSMSLNASFGAGDIFQTGGTVTIAGDTNMQARSGDAIVLDQLNDFSGKVNAVAGTITLKDSNSLVLGAFSANNGSATITASGAITGTDIVAVTGLLTLDAGAIFPGTNNIALTNLSNDMTTVAVVNGGNVTLVDSNSISLGGANIGGLYSVTAGGEVDIAGSVNAGDLTIVTSTGLGGVIDSTGHVVVSGETTITTRPNDNIILDSALNDFGTVNILDANNVTLRDVNDITLGQMNVNGTLNVTSDGKILGSGIISVAGVTTLNTTGINSVTNAINLSNADHDFSALNIVTAGSANIRDANSITLGGSIANDLKVTTSGGDVGNSSALIVGGNSTFVASGNVTLTNVNNDFDSLSVDAINATIQDSNTVRLSGLTISDSFTLVSGGDITQSAGAILTVANLTSLQATATGTSILLNGDNNRFDNIDISGRAVNLNLADTASVSSIVADSLILKGTSITANSASNITVTGLASITASTDLTIASDISAGGGLILASPLINLGVDGSSIAMTTTNSDVTLTGLDVSGNLSASDGNINIAGTVSVDTGTSGGSISIMSDTNGRGRIDKSVGATIAEVVASAGAGDIDLGDAGLTNPLDSLTINSGNNLKAGILNIDGNLDIDMAGDLTFENDVVSSGGNINVLSVSNVSLLGSATASNGTVTLFSSSGSVGAQGITASGNVDIAANTNISLGADVNSDSVVSVMSTNGSISQAKDTFVSADSITFSAKTGIAIADLIANGDVILISTQTNDTSPQFSRVNTTISNPELDWDIESANGSIIFLGANKAEVGEELNDGQEFVLKYGVDHIPYFGFEGKFNVDAKSTDAFNDNNSGSRTQNQVEAKIVTDFANIFSLAGINPDNYITTLKPAFENQAGAGVSAEDALRSTAASQLDDEEVAKIDEAAFQDLRNYDENPHGILLPEDQYLAYDDQGNVYYRLSFEFRSDSVFHTEKPTELEFSRDGERDDQPSKEFMPWITNTPFVAIEGGE